MKISTFFVDTFSYALTYTHNTYKMKKEISCAKNWERAS